MHQREVAALLADDLVAGGEWDQVGETLHHQRVAVVHERGDAVCERDDLSHDDRSTCSRSAHSYSQP